MLKHIKKGITLIEIVVSIGLIAMVTALLLPKIFEIKNKAEQEIVDIYNNKQTIIRIFNGHEISEEEAKQYKLSEVKHIDGIIYMYYVERE